MTYVKNRSAMMAGASDSVIAMKGAKGELPTRVRDHFFDVANARIDELKALGESEVNIGKRWGVSQNTINKIRGRTGGLGTKVLYGMRIDLRRSIDDILGLPPFASQAASHKAEGMQELAERKRSAAKSLLPDAHLGGEPGRVRRTPDR